MGVIEGGVGVLVRVAVDEDVAVDVAVAELVDVALAGLERVRLLVLLSDLVLEAVRLTLRVALPGRLLDLDDEGVAPSTRRPEDTRRRATTKAARRTAFHHQALLTLCRGQRRRCSLTRH